MSNCVGLTLKIVGSKKEIAELLELLKSKYALVGLSRYKPCDDGLYHRFVNLIPREIVRTEVRDR